MSGSFDSTLRHYFSVYDLVHGDHSQFRHSDLRLDRWKATGSREYFHLCYTRGVVELRLCSSLRIEFDLVWRNSDPNQSYQPKGWGMWMLSFADIGLHLR